MDNLELDNECRIYQNVEQKREDILWKYKFLVRLIKERRKDSPSSHGGEGGVKRHADPLHDGPGGKVQKTV